MRVGGQRHSLGALAPAKRPGTNCTRGCVGQRAGLNGCGKFRPHQYSITGPSSLYRVAIPTILSRPTSNVQQDLNLKSKTKYYRKPLTEICDKEWTCSEEHSCRGQLKCDGTRAETRFLFSAKRTSPFKSAGGRQFSRLMAAELCASAVIMLDTPCSEVV